MITKATLLRYLGRGFTVWKIAEIEGVVRNTVINWLMKYGIESPKGFFSRGLTVGRPQGIPMSEEQKELRRKRFSGKGNPFYGKTHSVKTRQKMSENHADVRGDRNPFRKSLEDPAKRIAHKTRCKKLWDERDSDYRRRFGERLKTGYGEIDGTFWARVRSNARVRDIDVTLTIEDAWGVFVAQEGLCALSGVPISFAKPDITASLDRIDSSGCYAIDNVQWVHKTVNMMKGKASQDEFVYFCDKVAQCRRA